MSISATMFVKLLNSKCPVILSKRFFPAFCKHRKIAIAKKRVFCDSNDSQKFSQMLTQSATALYNLGMLSCLQTGKLLKFHRFESEQHFSFFFFFFFILIFFIAEDGIMLNFF